MQYELNDGGRWAAGYRPRKAGDCVARAIAIAAELPYDEVWKELEQRQRQWVSTTRTRHIAKIRGTGGRKLELTISPDHGVYPQVFKPYLKELGFVWTPTMSIGSGATVHLRDDELPSGRLIVNVSRHEVAVVDGVVHDTYDPTRDGNRCVYGYWRRP